MDVLHKVSLATAVILLACLLPLPYGAYTLVRLLTVAVAISWSLRFYRQGRTGLAIAAFVVALLFQPVIKAAMDRTTWNIVDILLAVAIVVAVCRDAKAVSE